MGRERFITALCRLIEPDWDLAHIHYDATDRDVFVEVECEGMTWRGLLSQADWHYLIGRAQGWLGRQPDVRPFSDAEKAAAQ